MPPVIGFFTAIGSIGEIVVGQQQIRVWSAAWNTGWRHNPDPGNRGQVPDAALRAAVAGGSTGADAADPHTESRHFQRYRP